MSYKYKCKCGCIKSRNDVEKKYIKIDGVKTKRIVCKDHPTPIEGEAIARVYYCRDCSAYVDDDPVKSKSLRCNSCQDKISTLSAIRKRNKNKKKKELSEDEKKNIILDDPNNTFKCLNFNMCGMCIKPYFPCKMYDEGEYNDNTQE